ncbi:MAG: hemerythrin domain-containing protein [Nitrososphaerota archaeon]
MIAPTEVLKSEHRVIEKVITTMDWVGRTLLRGKRVDPSLIEEITDFMEKFADKCHHGKEENVLFEWMERMGVPKEGGPIGVMLYEHELGRSYRKAIVEALPSYKEGSLEAAKVIAENVQAYATMLSQHIMKEDNILFKIADELIAEKDDETYLMENFEKVERKIMGKGEHERLLKLADKIASALKEQT